jgi:hypothetical protein
MENKTPVITTEKARLFGMYDEIIDSPMFLAPAPILASML